MRLRISIPEEQVSSDVIDSGLEAVTRLNAQQIASGVVPTFGAALQAGRVQWRPEPPGDEAFDHAGLVLARGWGDCDDLAPWEAASLRVTGEDPGARARVVRSGPSTWHAIVERSSGAIADPSRAAGMGSNRQRVSGDEMPGIPPPVTVPMFRSRGHVGVGLVPHEGVWYARADLPWAPSPTYAWSATAADPDPVAALHAASIGACLIGHHAGWARVGDLASLYVTDCIAQGFDPQMVADSMAVHGMWLDAPSWARASVVGAAAGLCGTRCRRLAARL